MTPRPDGIRGATIAGTGMYVPERVLTNHDLEKMVDTSDEWIVERTGIRERRIAAPDQASSRPGADRRRSARSRWPGSSPDDVDQIIARHHDAGPHPAVVRVHAAAEARRDARRGLRHVRGLHRVRLRPRPRRAA